MGMTRLANIPAEEAILGAMLLSRDAVDAALGLLQPEHFHKPAHGHIYDAMVRLHRDGQPVDTITVTDTLTRLGHLDAVGGPGPVVGLIAAAGAVSAIPRHARIVLDMARLRRGSVLARELAESFTAVPEDVDGAIARAVRDFAVIQDEATDDDLLFAFQDVSTELMNRYLEAVEGNRANLGPTTGLSALDAILDGLAPGSLTIVGGRPGQGKTVVGCRVARSIAIDQRLPVVFASLEVPRVELAMRMTAAHCRIDYGRLKIGQLHDAEWEDWLRRQPKLDGCPLEILDDPHASLDSITAVARKAKRRHGYLGAVVVDYVQLMSGDDRAESRRVAVDQLSRGLKVLARDLECPVIALSQLNRSLEARSDKRPMLSDLRESGGLEQDADNVIFCYRDEEYDPDSEDRGIIELIVAKHRTGRTGTARCAWLGHMQEIANVYLQRG